MTKPIYILNGPNLNLLGEREPEIYGSDSLDDIQEKCTARMAPYDVELVFRQTNGEGELVDWVQEASSHASALILNGAAYTHTSVALLDALKVLEIPIIEVHLSNPFQREAFRHHSFISPAATAVICGLGAQGYLHAIDALAERLGLSKNHSDKTN